MSRFALDYPATPPFDSVRELVRMVRDGSLASQRAAFGRHLWIVQGYVQSQVLGLGEGGDGVQVVAAAQQRWTDEQALEELASVADFKPEFAATLPIPWRMLLGWLLEKAAGLL